MRRGPDRRCVARRGPIAACAALVAISALSGASAQVRVDPGVAIARPIASPPLPRLVVRRAPDAADCPDAPALAIEVGRHMGRPALDPDAPAWMPAIDVAIAREGAAFSAIVAIGGRERRLADPGPGCAGLGDALSVTLAILLDREGPPPLPLPPPPSAPPPPPPDRAAPPRPVAPPRSDPRVAVAVEGAFTYGLLGAAARPAFTALVELRVAGPIWVAPGIVWAPARSIDFPPGAVDVSLGAGTVRACAAAIGGAGDGPSISACVEPSIGALRGTGTGYASDASGTRLWASVGLGLVGRGPILGPLGWFAHAAGFALVGPREQFDVRGVPGIAYDPSPAGVSAGAGLRLSIY